MSMIAVNQTGYFIGHVKRATLAFDSEVKDEIKFILVDDKDNICYTGTTKVKGFDEDSKDYVHIIDFSDFDDAGVYKIKADNGESFTFAIGDNDKYYNLVRDAINYYYLNRSGVDIEEDKITSGDKKKLARPAGHKPDIASVKRVWNYDGPDETLDVTGGWYDAGDHGKYAVNAGVTLWSLFNVCELIKKLDAIGHSEKNKKVVNDALSDILSECRFELDFLEKMLVTNGKYKDMVYSRVHGIRWSNIGTAPYEEDMERILMPPTTAATLNVSAAFAHGARVYKESESEYSSHLLDIAKKTYQAAKEHPNHLAPVDSRFGGGSYDDDDVRDEFYWAAAELYCSTGEQRYLDDVKASDYYLGIPFRYVNSESPEVCGSYDWGMMATCGSLSILLNMESGEDYEKLKSNVIKTADSIYAIYESQGYGQAVTTEFLNINRFRGYAWGSNSYACDNAYIMIYAYYLTNDGKYLEAVIETLDYLLGRNPLNNSYITGYGTKTSKYPHHRFWSGQIRDDRPVAPDGVMVGGPNGGMQCAFVKDLKWNLKEMAPAKMYADNVDAYSTNECTINWNAAFLTMLLGILECI